MAPPIPGIEPAHDRYPRRIGRPDGKMGALPRRHASITCAPSTCQSRRCAAFAQIVFVLRADHRAEAVGILDLPGLAQAHCGLPADTGAAGDFALERYLDTLPPAGNRWRLAPTRAAIPSAPGSNIVSQVARPRLWGPSMENGIPDGARPGSRRNPRQSQRAPSDCPHPPWISTVQHFGSRQSTGLVVTEPFCAPDIRHISPDRAVRGKPARPRGVERRHPRTQASGSA